MSLAIISSLSIGLADFDQSFSNDDELSFRYG